MSHRVSDATKRGSARYGPSQAPLMSLQRLTAPLSSRGRWSVEGFCTDGTAVLLGTPNAIDVAWQDRARTRVANVRTREAGGRWRAPKGVRVGTRLSELERLAGAVITFFGFGWDYGGGTDWSEGAGSLGLSLDIDPADPKGKTVDPEGRAIFGDRLVRSDHPMIRAIRVRVTEMTQSWGQHAGERDCER